MYGSQTSPPSKSPRQRKMPIVLIIALIIIALVIVLLPLAFGLLTGTSFSPSITPSPFNVMATNSIRLSQTPPGVAAVNTPIVETVTNPEVPEVGSTLAFTLPEVDDTDPSPLPAPTINREVALAPADIETLSQAVDNTQNAGTITINYNMDLRLEREGEFGEVYTNGNFIADVSQVTGLNFEVVQFQNNATYGWDVEGMAGEAQVNLIVKDNFFYAEGSSDVNDLPWIQIPLESVLGDTYSMEEFERLMNMAAEGDPVAVEDDPLFDIMGAMDFGRYAYTQNMGREGGLIRYQTDIDVYGLVASEDFTSLANTVGLMATLAGEDSINAASIANMQTQFPNIAQGLSLTINRYVDPNTQYITRIDVALDMITGTIPAYTVEANINMQFSDFDQPVNINAPEGADSFDSLGDLVDSSIMLP